MSSANASNAAAASISSNPSSSLRPRNRRLISGLDEDSGSAEGSGTYLKSSPFISPLNSRAASPIPSLGPSRTPSSQNIPRSRPTDRNISYGSRTSSGRQESSGALTDFWGNPWSSLQGLASNVLGSGNGSSDKQSRRGKTKGPLQSRTLASVPPSEWGISPAQTQVDVGAGSKEERENMVRTMKRRDLLNANGHVYQDTVGRFKRRNSDERISSSAPPNEADDRDALVYVHHVQKSDTLAGLTIKYNCQLPVLRKANRMWPNDSVQTRKIVVIPVDACGVKGRRCAGPGEKEEELLLGDEDDSKTITDSRSNGQPVETNRCRPRAGTNTSVPPTSNASTKSDSEPPWTHDSWVILPHNPEPIEIARLPRRTLGFFPPARRKSLTFSDANTPSTSFDLPRSLNATTLSSPKQNPDENTSVTSSPPSIAGRRTRPRKPSISQSFLLQGPGGVGSLGKNVRSPGPGEDALNKFIATHLPNMQATTSQEYFTPWTPALLEQNGISEGATAIGYASSSSNMNVGIDFEQVGGAIESWMRKTAAKVSAAMNDPSNASNRQFAPVPGLGAEGGGLGDLIELRDDAFEIGDDEDELGRGRQPPPGSVSTSRPDLPSGLRERDTGASSRKSGKGD